MVNNYIQNVINRAVGDISPSHKNNEIINNNHTLSNNYGNGELLQGYSIRTPDRIKADIQPLDKTEAAYQKALRTFNKRINDVNTIISNETKKYEEEMANLEVAINETKKLYNAANDELNAIITKDKLDNNEIGIAAGGKVTYYDRKLEILTIKKTATLQFSEKGKEELRTAVKVAQESEVALLNARRDYIFSIDKYIIEDAITKLAEVSSISSDRLNSIINCQAVKTAFITDSELMKAIDYSTKDLINIILLGN